MLIPSFLEHVKRADRDDQERQYDSYCRCSDSEFWKLEWIRYYQPQKCKNQREDPDENYNGSYAIAGQDFTVANVGDCNVAIKTN